LRTVMRHLTHSGVAAHFLSYQAKEQGRNRVVIASA